jgi:hypothetical protein
LLIGAAIVTGAGGVAGILVSGSLAHTRADAAADAVALAAAGALFEPEGQCGAAARIAAANGARLVQCRPDAAVVTVRIALPRPPLVERILGSGEVGATAAAQMVWDGGTGPGGSPGVEQR